MGVAWMVKNWPANTWDLRDVGSIPGLGRSPGGGHSNPFQYSCLENSMDRGAWWARVHRVAKSRTWQKWPSTQHIYILVYTGPYFRGGNGTRLQYSWKIPWTEVPGRLQSMGSLRVRHDWATSLSLFTFMHRRRKWQPTPVFLPGESQGRGEPGGPPSMGSHRVRHDWSDLAAAGPYFKKTCYLLNKLIKGVIYFFKHVFLSLHYSTVYDR